MAASLKGNVELIKYMVEVCNDVVGHSIVNECVIRDAEVVRFLTRQAKVWECKRSGVDNLRMMSCVCSGLTDCVQYLLDNNIHNGYKVISYVYGTSCVEKATCNGYHDVVKYLVENSAGSYHCRVSESMCAAASSGHLSLFEYLAKSMKVVFLFHQIGRSLLSKLQLGVVT